MTRYSPISSGILGRMDILSTVATIAVIGAFIYIVTQWSKGGDDDNSCNT